MPKTCSTKDAAKRIGVAFITLNRWISEGIVKASVEVPMKGMTLRRWTDADIRRAQKLVGGRKPGRKPKAKGATR